MIRRLAIVITATAGVLLGMSTAAHASPVESSTATAGAVTITVRSGDTVSELAVDRCGSWVRYRDAIRRANPHIADLDRIWPGDRVILPCRRHTTHTASRASTRTAVHTSRTWMHPLPGARPTSCYGPRWGGFHRGIDLAKPTGTRVRAAAAGVIVSAGWRWTGYGISVVIRHGNGTWTHYAHMSRALVHRGQHVSAGQTIGRVGSTGQATGPHLHFEVGRHGMLGHQVNPARWLRNHGVRSGC